MTGEKKPLIILTGPTAVGKTKLSVRLAGAVGGEIISADSMQVYRRMDIGTAKIKECEMHGIRHHLIDVLEPEEPFSAAVFREMAKDACEDILERGHIPIVAGGTGFYIQGLLYDIDFGGRTDDGGNEAFGAVKSELERILEEEGAYGLYTRLEAEDPKSSAAIHPNNVKRVLRALEYHRLTGESMSDHNAAERMKTSPYNFAYFVLDDEREKLYARIDARVDRMIFDGLVEEVKGLKAEGCSRGMVSMQGLGYKEILAYLDGDTDLDEAVRIIKRDTRHFAKRQLTWFRRERDVIYVRRPDFDCDDDRMLEYMLKICREKGII